MTDEIKLTLMVGRMAMEYAGCGTHRFEVTITSDAFGWRSSERAHLLYEIARIDAELPPEKRWIIRNWYDTLDAADWRPELIEDDDQRAARIDDIRRHEHDSMGSPERTALFQAFRTFKLENGPKPERP